MTTDDVGLFPDYDWEDIKKPTQDNKRHLAQRLKYLRDTLSPNSEYRKLLETDRLIDKCNLTSAHDKLNNYIAGRPSALPDNDYVKLAQFVWDQKMWTSLWLKEGIATQPGALWHALTMFLDIGTSTIVNLVRRAGGTYRLWRPSMHWPGRYVLGMLEVSSDNEEGTLRTVETHRFSGADGSRPASEVFEGYLHQKSRYLFMIARQTGSVGPPRFTIVYNQVLDQKGCISSMQGIVIGAYGDNQRFAAPVLFERIEETPKQFSEEIDIVENVPGSVAAKLAHIRLEAGVIHF